MADATSIIVEKNKAIIWRQHVGACTACLSAFMVGNNFGWSSFASLQFLEGTAGFSVTKGEFSLVESLLAFGAAVSCLPTGYVMDKFGRKKVLLGLAPIFLLGWCLLIWANSVAMLYAGRFILGTSVGSACIVAPIYAAEICQKEIRGGVGTYFQLLLGTGTLFSFVIGSLVEVFWLSLICATVPIIFGILLLFFPETPVYYLTQEDVGRAKNSFLFFRGKNYDVESELCELSDYCHQNQDVKHSVWKTFASIQGRKSVLMSIGLMIFQQLCGINAIVFNATDIFQNTGSTLDARYQTIIMGSMQVAGSILVIFLVDNLGRVMLLGLSAIWMSLSTFLLGIFFYLKENDYETQSFSWLPVFSLSVFLITFSVGFGAVSWMLMSELMPAAIRGPGTSIACITNWITALIVTKFYSDLVTMFGIGVTFWIFSTVSLTAAVFSFRVLPETRGKSFEEIQTKLAGSKMCSVDNITKL